LTNHDKDVVFDILNQLVGTDRLASEKAKVLVTNVERRMALTKKRSFADYLQFALSDSSEFANFLSALTIHHTLWFRERSHFELLEKHLTERLQQNSGRGSYRFLSAACSSGEEVYSLGLVCEKLRERFIGFDYEIIGIDLDPVSLRKARRAVYRDSFIQDIPQSVKSYLLLGSGPTQGLFTVDRKIRQRCRFQEGNLYRFDELNLGVFDVILCRNVLIYFSESRIRKIVQMLAGGLRSAGILCLGHSESFDLMINELQALGHSMFFKQQGGAAGSARRAETGSLSRSFPPESHQVGVMVIDSEDHSRQKMTRFLKHLGYQVFPANSLEEAQRRLAASAPRLIIVDLALADRHILHWLSERRRQGLDASVAIAADATAKTAENRLLRALTEGAQDFFEKSWIEQSPDRFSSFIREIIELPAHDREAEAQKTAHMGLAASGCSEPLVEDSLQKPQLILLGASTGGTEALSRVLSHLPVELCPPVVIVQHIPQYFARSFLERLVKISGMKPGLMEDGTRLQAGHIYLALGDYHLGVDGTGSRLRLRIAHDRQQFGHRPSVEYLFQSACRLRHCTIAAVLLTGMGRDGARGLKSLHERGATTLVQDPDSCVVFGMPKEALKLGAADFIGTPETIRGQLIRLLRADTSEQVA
jgi:two-component system chemotaxis response regulator CheB